MSSPIQGTPLQPPLPSQVVYVQQATGNGLAVAGFVCALLGVLFGLIPILAGPAMVLGILGVTFGAIGRKRAETRHAGKGLATAALVLGIAAIGLAVLGFVIVSNAVNDLNNAALLL